MSPGARRSAHGNGVFGTRNGEVGQECGPIFGSMIRTTILCCLFPAVLVAQDKATLDAVIATKRFPIPAMADGPTKANTQLDLHISVLGNTAVWKANADGERQAHVEALSIIEKDTTIIDFRKSDIVGPGRTDTLVGDFLIEEHFVLPPGEYTLSVELHDLNGPADNHSVWKGPLVIPEPGKGVEFSDIMLTDGTRQDAQGNTVPAPFSGTYYPPEAQRLGFYTEILGTPGTFGTGAPFIINYQIETYETHSVKGGFKGTQRASAAPVVTLSKEFSIDQLPSGNYLLAVEVVGNDGAEVARQEQFFQRNNPLKYDLNALESVDITSTFADAFTDPDTLAEHLACLRPIAQPLERRMIDERLKDRDMTLMKRFFYTFWANRDGYDPERAWKSYHVQVVNANRMYGCRNLRGYESDQGITFLKYGLPSTVVDGSRDNKQLPYLIWHYYRAGRYSDKRFVFWEQNTGIGCWELLHSEIPGERHNPQWQAMLSAPLGNASMTDGTRVLSTEGQRVEDNFLRPH